MNVKKAKWPFAKVSLSAFTRSAICDDICEQQLRAADGERPIHSLTNTHRRMLRGCYTQACQHIINIQLFITRIDAYS